MRRTWFIALISTFVIAASLLTPFSTSAPAAAAPPGSAFEDGYIISDQKFFDYGSMDSASVQSFLNARVSNCVGGNGQPCLKDFRTTGTPIAGDSFCSGMPGGSMSAADIIVAAARACRISPKVLIVMLQKEQGLITATSPTAWNYQAALGQSCPDTAPCDSAFSGFYRQVYYGARQMRMYIAQPGWYAYQLGWNNILYSPNASCGTKSVNIRNNATRALYIYTPYTPNQAALTNLYGTGDGCSTYGNRNFWRYYWDWFGSPTDASPIGSFDSASPAANGIRVNGWALDFDTEDPTTIHVYVNGAFASGFGATQPRPDVQAAHQWGVNRGFNVVVPAPMSGTNTVCVYALNVGSGSNTELGCRQVTMLPGDPIGNLDNVVQQPGGLGVWGWALDPDASGSSWVHAYLDGRFVGAYYADASRNDVAEAYAGFGDKRGYSFNLTASTGTHRLCIYAINVNGGSKNTELGCREATVGGSPVGPPPSTSSGPQELTVSGWAVDPDTTSPMWVHIYVDGRFAAGAYADQERSDMNVYHTFGSNHGYSATVTAGSGWHNVCVYGINVLSGANSELGCTRAQVGGSPIGSVSDGQPGYGAIGVWGWAYDPDVVDPTAIHIYMDGVFAWGGAANLPSGDATIPPAYGTEHGFAARFQATSGRHEVCVYSLNFGVGGNTRIGCFTTTVASADPVGALDSVTATSSAVQVSGWAIDADTRDAIWVHIYVDGGFAGAALANQSRADVSTQHPGYVSGGYSTSVSALPGQRNVCVYAINVGGGTTNTQLGCRTVTVP